MKTQLFQNEQQEQFYKIQRQATSDAIKGSTWGFVKTMLWIVLGLVLAYVLFWVGVGVKQGMDDIKKRDAQEKTAVVSVTKEEGTQSPKHARINTLSTKELKEIAKDEAQYSQYHMSDELQKESMQPDSVVTVEQ